MIRALVADDVPAVAQLFCACFQDSYAGVVPHSVRRAMTVERARALWEESTAVSGPGNTLVAVSDDDAARILGVTRVSGPGPDGSGTVESLYVSPDSQGHGLGRKLMAAALDRQRELGAQRAQLWVFATNAGAQFLYESMGYVLDGRTRVEREYGVMELGMSIPLGGQAQ